MRRRRVIGSLAVMAPLLAILAASVWFAVHGWMAIEGGAISVAGYVAMAAGVTFTLIVGVGLMSLVFYSHRHGYDDAADRGRSEPKE
jgi:cation transporter-like permease